MDLQRYLLVLHLITEIIQEKINQIILIFKLSVTIYQSLDKTIRKPMSHSYRIKSRQCFMLIFFRCNVSQTLNLIRMLFLEDLRLFSNLVEGIQPALQTMVTTSWTMMTKVSTLRRCLEVTMR